ncbi:MAG: 3-deoxy-8-phosphooctulonate synthase [Candidatus Omnitrophica bacterium]|nr:3-deoxy-8-phosphooctulonate synthase [Candidatus Omnitrophota bacterium]MDE2009973.1 3-deoxy-8-phosphooctulonate synthase [Candidatus Omnitrophota bacterium]MDE2213951.1 3-deoxy-8-phosphooctulonate synthase [Candidatus Omnitrophota bacterium]MDE2231899.1 3-deoxy-8-phosphooctulonate synthase [Candidatus Omnitrophota bacterium]
MVRKVKISDKVIFGGRDLVLIAGPCVIESASGTLKIAEAIQKITSRLRIPFVFKASYDKANRTSIKSFRGPGVYEGLKVLSQIKSKLGVPVLSDVHDVDQAQMAGEILDIVQIPAFLCRQTDLIVAAARTGKAVNVKKGQFMAPWDAGGIVKKMQEAGNHKLLLTERGVTFGYNNLVTDFRALSIMRAYGYPVIFDATHSVQKPGGLGDSSGGESRYIPLLARCAVAAGVDAVFLETHPDPSRALSDGPNSLRLRNLENLLKELVAIDRIRDKNA